MPASSASATPFAFSAFSVPSTPPEQHLATRQIRPDPLRTALRAARRTHPVEQRPDAVRKMPPLAPAADPVPRRRPRRLPDRTPHRVPQQAHVRRVMRVGLHREGITPPPQRLSRLFSGHRVAAVHHQPPHRREQLRRHQRHVVDQRLQLVPALIGEIPVRQHRPHRAVVVRQIVKAVEIAAQALLQNPQNQDPPQVHPRTAHCPVRPGADVRLQQPEQLLAPLHVQVLKPLQYRRDVVARLRIQPDVPDRHLAELHLPPLNFAHAFPSKIARKTGRNGPIVPLSRPG